MGRELYCDFCRASAPIENALQKITVADRLVGEACLTCSSQLERGLKAQIAEAHKKYKEAINPLAPEPQRTPALREAVPEKAPVPRDGPATAGGK